MRRTPAQTYALAVGAVLALGGVLGFFYNASFATGDATLTDRDAVLGVLDVNGWHNVVHAASGAVGLVVAGSWHGARLYALALGAVYAVVAVAGFAAGDGESLLGLLPVNTEDNVLHALIALGGVGAYAGTASEPAPTTV